jgi:hypothetical protein
MKTRVALLCLIGILVVLGGVNALAQGQAPVARLLLIDGTKTFTSTMKVAGAIGALRQTGILDVSVRLSEGVSDFGDPLEGIDPDAGDDPFDFILILPRGLDTQSGVSIWLVSHGLDALSPFVRGAVDLVSNIVDLVFEGSGKTIDVSEDLWPGFLAATYDLRGWLR